MIETIKEKIWGQLQDKEVSLAMIFDDQGEILWHRGRSILKGKTLDRGCGYCSSQARQVLQEKKGNVSTRCVATYSELRGQESANLLNINSLVVLPVGNHHFLYVDSGVKLEFSETDIAVFISLGALLGDLLAGLQQKVAQSGGISGTSVQAEAIRTRIIKYAIEEDPVLLLGETGSGKSRVAELIHRFSGRSGPLVVINTPGIPDTLIESQLFGHRKGAFSGAVSDSQGLVAAAAQGTLFLDEIAEINPAVQAKLLRFIDTRQYQRLGETVETHADVRLIAATNRNLKQMIGEKTFREDLFFRLNFLTISLPPLRQRPEDIEVLIEENLPLLRGKRLSDEARSLLLEYHWPGNVRELIQVFKKAGIEYSGVRIGTEIRELLTFDSGDIGSPERIERIWRELQAGVSFWKAVKEPYMKRELNRDQVQEIVGRGLRDVGGKYRRLLPIFNLETKEYKSFMSFLYDNHLQ